MRADSERLIAAADVLPSGDTAHAAALGRAFAAIVGLIHEHHWTEDDVMHLETTQHRTHRAHTGLASGRR
jgi:hypothetical protein